MMWKIIVLLPCFDVLVNAGIDSPYFTGSSSQNLDPYRTFNGWVNSLDTRNANLSSVVRFPSPELKNTARDKLKLSKCPPGDVESLITRSSWDYWPNYLRLNQEPFVNLSYINGLKFRSIPGLSAVVASVHENSIGGLHFPGILLFF